MAFVLGFPNNFGNKKRNHLPFRALTYPTWETENQLQKWLVRGYVNSLFCSWWCFFSFYHRKLPDLRIVAKCLEVFSKHRLANPRLIPATWNMDLQMVGHQLDVEPNLSMGNGWISPNIHYQPSLAEVLFLGVWPWFRSLANDGSFVKGGVSTLLLSLKEPLNPFSNLFDKLVGFQR